MPQLAGVLRSATRAQEPESLTALLTSHDVALETLDRTRSQKWRLDDDQERRQWFAMLAGDSTAQAAELPDLTAFMMATGARIGETLGLTWREIDLDAGAVSITQQVIRVRGEGLVRARTKSRAGERVLRLPSWAIEILRRRADQGVCEDEPVFCDALGHFRDPANVRRDLRRARSPVGSQSRQQLGPASPSPGVQHRSRGEPSPTPWIGRSPASSRSRRPGSE